jgi:small subunit ribosomal protein S16
MGKIREPYYRIIVADARTKRDGRAIEEIGKYHPKADPSFIEVNSDRAQHWLSVGAQPTDPVRKILEITGDWQKFKGLPGAEGTLMTAASRADKKEAFAAALAESLADSGATTPKGGGRGKAGGAKAGDGRAGGAKAGDAKAGDAKAGDGKAGGAKGDAKAGGAKADAKAGDGKSGDAKAGDGKADKADAGAGKASDKADSGDGKADKADAGAGKASDKAKGDEAEAAGDGEVTAAATADATSEPGTGD